MPSKLLKNKFVLSGLITLGAVGLIAGIASAHMGVFSDRSFGDFSKLLAERFNLNQTEVENFLNEQKQTRIQEMHAQMKVKMEERLNQAVSEGTITEAQKQLILEKHAEIQTKMESLKTGDDFDPEVIRLQMKSFHDEMVKWAEENNIPEEFMGQGTGKWGHHLKFHFNKKNSN